MNRFISRLVTTLATLMLDAVDAIHKEPCRAYGGHTISGNADRVRLCNKRRWHTDSHAYEWGPA